MRILARRTPSGLIPADEQAVDELRRVPVGKPVYIEIKAARNPKQHRMLFALLNMLVNAGAFPTTDAALVGIKLATGLIDSVILSPTETQIIPRSISFANMPQGDFAPWFDAAIRAVCERWLPGLSDDQIRKEIEEMLA